MILHGLTMQDVLPTDHQQAILVGRVWRPGIGPSLAVVRGGYLIDITSPTTPTMASLFEQDDVGKWIFQANGPNIGSIEAILANSDEKYKNPDQPFLLSPVDLQPIKAAGVTFAVSLLERVIEEQARGNPEHANAIRASINDMIGGDLRSLQPGSKNAEDLKAALIKKNIWSQYLEVGIGPDPEIFTKCQIMSSVGFGANVGIDAKSTWNNPEPEIAVIVSHTGRIMGATLANDVNLRDFEGRSALLLSKAKDNNASCSLGPFIRIFDEHYTYEDLLTAHVRLKINGADGFKLESVSKMDEISRLPYELVQATINKNHQYPDGFILLLGTMFAPTQDRDFENAGFTHRPGDVVSISSEKLGRLINQVQYCHDCEPWTFGVQALMKNLTLRQLL